MRALIRAAFGLMTIATFVASLWSLAQNPFAQPMIAQSDAAVRATLAQARASVATPEWITAEIEAALARKDYDDLVLLVEVATAQGISLPPEQAVRLAAFADEEERLSARVADCALCAYDMSSCQRIAQLAACAIPVEVSPLGDLNALRRAGVDWALGEEVDKVDATLAAAGLGATGLAAVTGGSTLSVKAGAAVLRLARKLGALTPRFGGFLLDTANLALDWDRLPEYLRGAASLEEITDARHLETLGAVARDLGTLREHTSTAEALLLMRHIDSAAEAAGLARVATLEGAGTRATLRVIGKSRTLRALVRVSNLALLTIGLLTALALQGVSTLGWLMRRMLRRRKAPVA